MHPYTAIEPPLDIVWRLMFAPLDALRLLVEVAVSPVVRAGDRIAIGDGKLGHVRAVRLWYAVVDTDDGAVVLVPIKLARVV